VDVAHAQLAVGEQRDDAEPGLVTQSLEQAGDRPNVERAGTSTMARTVLSRTTPLLVWIPGPPVRVTTLPEISDPMPAEMPPARSSRRSAGDLRIGLASPGVIPPASARVALISMMPSLATADDPAARLSNVGNQRMRAAILADARAGEITRHEGCGAYRRIGCASKNFHISSDALMSCVVSSGGRSTREPGHVWPPPSTM
jgi:hypothetical protein